MTLQRPSFHFSYYFVLVFSALIILTSCSRPSAIPADEVRVALGAPAASLDPRLATDVTGMGISSLTYTALFHLDPHLNLVGEWAEKWTYSNLTYSISLKPGLRFANHSEVKTEDILFSFAEFMKPSCPFSSNFKMIESIDARYSGSERYIKIKLKKFSSSFLTDLRVLKILPRDSSAGGSGNFVLIKDENNILKLQAREDALIKPKIKFLSFYFVRDDYTRFLKLLSHEVDIAENEIDLRRVSEFVKRPDEFVVEKNPSLSMTYILINLKNEFLKDKKVRQALDLALNRDLIIKYKLENLAMPATSLLAPIHPMFNPDLKNPDYDLEKARTLVASLPKEKLSFKSSNAGTAVENVSVIVDQLKKLGLAFNQQSYEWGTFYSDIKSGNYDLALSRWVGLVDADIYRQAFHSEETPPGRNRGFYKNSRVDELTSQALATEDFSQRQKLYFEAQKIVFEDLPVIPMWYDMDIAIVSRRIKNFRAYPADQFQFANEIEL